MYRAGKASLIDARIAAPTPDPAKHMASIRMQDVVMKLKRHQSPLGGVGIWKRERTSAPSQTVSEEEVCRATSGLCMSADAFKSSFNYRCAIRQAWLDSFCKALGKHSTRPILLSRANVWAATKSEPTELCTLYCLDEMYGCCSCPEFVEKFDRRRRDGHTPYMPYSPGPHSHKEVGTMTFEVW